MANKDTTLFTEKRRAKRIIAPSGTTALFLSSTGSLDTVCVGDISVNGMLLCGYNSEEKYPANSLIYNIYVDIPPCKSSAGKRTCILIDRGKVVRSLYDQASKTFCYGIELMYKSSYTKNIIEGLVKMSNQ